MKTVPLAPFFVFDRIDIVLKFSAAFRAFESRTVFKLDIPDETETSHHFPFFIQHFSIFFSLLFEPLIIL